MNTSEAISVAIVDDDVSVGQSLGRLLRAEGITSVAYTSAEAFLAETPHPRFDCLVLDMRLTGISGVELHRRLVAAGDRTPVIFLTAYDPNKREQALTTSGAAYFRKTAATSDVIAAIRRVSTPQPNLKS
jgi:FixJ family two-component response regulator